jgi:hypothetical protein
MSAHTKGSRTWCEQHCDHGCKGACMARSGESHYRIPHNGRAVAAVNSKVRRAWLGGPKNV